MTIKHLQEVDHAINFPGAEVFSACEMASRVVGCFCRKISTPNEVMLMLVKSQLWLKQLVKRQ